jgi:hypothetical protein
MLRKSDFVAVWVYMTFIVGSHKLHIIVAAIYATGSWEWFGTSSPCVWLLFIIYI